MSTYREPLFDINSLSPTQDLAATISKTNEIVDSINTLYAADVFEGDGICTTRADGVVTVNVDPGPGIGIALTGEVTLNFNNVNSVNSTQNDDTLFIGRSNTIYKVNAESILPPTVLGNHIFSGLLTFNVNPSMFGFTNNIATVVAENSSLGSPKGVSIKTYTDSGLNLAPRGFIRNYISESGTSAALFNYATTAFNSNPQNKIIVSYYTGLEDTSELIKNHSSSSLAWPTKWSWEYSETQAVLNVATTVDSDGEVEENPTISYNYNSANAENSLFTINGKIFVSNLQNSSQFISAPDGSANRVVLTTTEGLINKKFTNRIITTDVEPGGLAVGDLVAVFLETNNNTYYGKAQANESGNTNVIGIVESYFAGEATIVLSGEFELSTALLEPGTTYVLSQTSAGDFETNETYTSGIIKPVFVAVTQTSGILLNSTTSANSISSITLDNANSNPQQTLNIDSPNYELKFVAGPNIEFNLTTNEEIEIRVVDAAGAQDVFSTVLLNGGDSITASSPTDTLSFISDSLTLQLDTDGSSVRIETPNLYTSALFTNTGNNFTLTPTTTNDTLEFVAGNGIVFEQDGSSVVINASISGGVNPNNINFGGPFRVLVSDAASTGKTLSLYGGGGDGDAFDGAASGYDTIDIALNPSLNITYNTTTQAYTYNGQNYYRHETFGNPNYLPDELAGYMFGRITPSPVGDNVSNPDNKIRRLSRKDVRYFLGLATDGYIDSVDKVFNTWRIFDSSGTQVGNSVQAESKEGYINFQQGSGILIEEGMNDGGSPTVKISNTATPQNTFSSYFVDNSEWTAESIADSIYFESGSNIELIGTTNNTVTFNLVTPNDYTVLGNSGNTNASNEIDLSADDYCILGRSGAEIRPLVSDDFKWSLVGSNFVKPDFEMPFFGLLSVVTGASTVHCDASISGKVQLLATGGITLSADGNSTDGYTITIGGTPGTGPSSGLNFVTVNNSTYSVGPDFTTLKFVNGPGVGFTSETKTTANTVVVTGTLNAISANSILANASGTDSVPSAFAPSTNSLVGRLNGNLQSVSFDDVKTALDIRHYNRVQYTNNGTDNFFLNTLSAAARTGANLKFAAGTNVSFSGASSDVLTISATTNLATDTNPIFASVVPANTGAVAIQDGTVVKYGTSTSAITGLKYNSYLNLFGVGQGTSTQYALRKEALTTIPTGYTLATVTSDLGKFTNQRYIVNSNYTETVYAANYALNVKQYSTTGIISAGNYALTANNATITSSNFLFDSAGLGKVEFTNKKLSSAYTPSGGPTQSSTFVMEAVNISTPVVIKSVSAASNTGIADSALYLQTNNTGVRLVVSGDSSSWLNVAGSGINQIITSSGTINFGNNVTFNNNTTVTFNGTVTGLTFPSHAASHQSTTSINNHTAGSAADKLFAWQVGAVDRSKPTMQNKLAITNTSVQEYGFDLSSVANSVLFGTSAAAAITNQISNSDRGPLYLVLNTGEEANLAAFSGPPGQIIMIKKA